MANKQLNNAKQYAKRAKEEIAQLDTLLKMDALYLCVSRCYYAAYYSMKAVLGALGVKTASHKQTQIAFRQHFIKTDEIDKKYSKILTELYETRSQADYNIYWATNKTFVEKIVKDTKDFVDEVLYFSK